MMLGITAQVKEAGIAWDKGEKKSKPGNLGSFPQQGVCALCVLLALGK